MNKYILISMLSILFLTVSCNKDNNNLSEQFVVTTGDEINSFIWKGLNLYYLWQKEVPLLADDRFTNSEELMTFYKNNSTPEATFNSLLNQPNVVDRFSWIVDDYVALENSFQGINLGTGMEFGLVRYKDVTTDVFGYVRYVIPNSSAAAEGIQRGMIFNFVNGTQLTDQNYKNLLFSEDTILSIGLADYNSGNPIKTGIVIDLTKAEIQENPIAISKIIAADTKKIGYLLYNQFASSYDLQLNAVFNNFKSENIDELIIDLRYNGGGSVRTATYLGSMVTGQFSDQVYSKQRWNAKVTAEVSADFFINNFFTTITTTDTPEAIHSLKLNNVYFIVSGSSASASELIINSLNPYINVKVLGTTTVGKQVGSITLYDSKNLQRDGQNLNTNHTYAMQPIVLEITDKNGVNYPSGITPGTNFPGIYLSENFANLGVLGERSDPLLDRTLTYITTGARTFSNKENHIKTAEIFNSKLGTLAADNMYFNIK